MDEYNGNLFSASLFAERLKEARKNAGFKTQKSLSAVTGISQQNLSSYESKTKPVLPSLSTMYLLATTLHCSVDKLLGLPDNPDAETENQDREQTKKLKLDTLADLAALIQDLHDHYGASFSIEEDRHSEDDEKALLLRFDNKELVNYFKEYLFVLHATGSAPKEMRESIQNAWRTGRLVRLQELTEWKMHDLGIPYRNVKELIEGYRNNFDPLMKPEEEAEILDWLQHDSKQEK